MEYRETVKKVIAEVCCLLLGVVFILSRTVKAVDPMGGVIKTDDYLTSFGLDKLRPFTVLISFNLSALEFMLGVCMLLGVYRRYTTFLILLMISFVTPLALYLTTPNPVSDCGCFEDVLVISDWQTFYKNVVLLATAIYVFIHNQWLLQGYTYHVYWLVALWSYAFTIGFAYRNYNHLPILNFRSYKLGTNIPALMLILEGAPEDEYTYSFIYERDGVQKEFSLEGVLADDSMWTFVDSKTRLIKQGYVPPVTTFHIYNENDADVTDELLNDPRDLFFLIAPRLENMDDERIDEVSNVYNCALENGLGFYCVTGSSAEAIATWSDNTGAKYPFLMADDVLLKTIIRSNPGLALLKKGMIPMRWHYNDIPQEEDLKTIVNGYLEGDTDWKVKEDTRLITNLLSFTVPLLPVWGYDALRNHCRRKGKESE